jgi:hypothetical protein
MRSCIGQPACCGARVAPSCTTTDGQGFRTFLHGGKDGLVGAREKITCCVAERIAASRLISLAGQGYHELREVYRQRADECAQLANEAAEVYVKVALSELAAEFQNLADAMEQESLEQASEARGASKLSVEKRAAHKRAA